MVTVAHPRERGATAPAETIFGRVTIFGLLLFAAAGALLLVAATVSGDPGFAVFAAILTVVPGALAVLVSRSGPWALIATAVLMLLGLLFVGPELPFSLSHASSFFDFAPGVVAITGAVIALVAAVAGFVKRNSSEAAPASLAERRTKTGIVAVLVVAALISGVATLNARSSVSATAKAGATIVKMKSTKFAPKQLSARAGESTRLVIKNDDPAVHSFTIKQLGIDYTVGAGSEKLVQIEHAAPGTYTYICRWHDNMMGTLTVTR